MERNLYIFFLSIIKAVINNYEIYFNLALYLMYVNFEIWTISYINQMNKWHGNISRQVTCSSSEVSIHELWTVESTLDLVYRIMAASNNGWIDRVLTRLNQ